MTMNLSRIAGIALAILCSASCITVNSKLGEDYIAMDHQYDIYTAEFDIEDIRMEYADSLSGYSLYRFTVGSLRDETFGLTTRSAAFTLVPINDTLDFGKPGTQKFRQFHFSAVSDSTSFTDPNQEHILQTINVYELDKTVDFSKTNPEIITSKKRISDGIPIYNGTDSLSFNFTREFGEKYMQITAHDLDSIANYTQKFPGIYITVDEPAGFGGRLNMFKVPINVVDGYFYGSTAELKFTAEYEDRGQVDTSFTFYIGPLDVYSLAGVTSTTVSSHPQLAYNISSSESQVYEGKAEEKIYFEGGTGLKPVIKAASLREKVLDVLSRYGDPESIVISKATIQLPFEFPDDYTKMNEYPKVLSPTCRIVTDTTTTYASLTDASVSSENQGQVNRSTCMYSPDMSHHIQEMVKIKDLSNIGNYDIWLLAMRDEVITEGNQSSESDNDWAEYYQQMAYANYYQSMYGGYGYGYGSGYSSNYYSNYYNYAMMAQMYSSANSGSSASVVSLMDFHRFYKGVLNGPAAEGARPKFKITFAVPKTGE